MKVKVKSWMLAVALATVALGVAASSASAQGLPSLPSLPAPPTSPVGTGGECATGLIVVNLGGQTLCAAPGSPQVGAAPACPEGSTSVVISAQSIVCVLPGGGTADCPGSYAAVQQPTGGSIVCVLTTNITQQDSGGCNAPLIPVVTVGGGVPGCVIGSAFGPAGANGTNGQDASGRQPVIATPTPVPSRTGAASTSKRKIYKPTLKMTSRLRGSARGLVRSSTKKIVVTTLGRRHGRVVRYTKQFSLKRSGPATAARPYAARVKITFKTTGRVSIRITSRGGGSIKTATFKRTVRPR